MTVIGIDFSINSTALTIKSGKKRVGVYSFVPNLKEGKKEFRIHEELSSEIKVISYTKESTSKDSYEDQRIKLRNADRLSTAILSIFEELNIDSIDEIRIEGFSYMSKGNSFIDLIMFNTFLKVKLIQRFGHVIKVVPPKSLKKAYTGNGNASKCGMLRSFVELDKSKLCKKILALNLITEEEFVIPKPIDDLVDSIALTEVTI